MADISATYRDELTGDDDFAADGAGVATLDAEDSRPVVAGASAGPSCVKCQAPLQSEVVTICRRCGWYASLGTFVEVDPDWESVEDQASPAKPATATGHVQVWINMVPRWGWIIIGSVFAVVVESVIVRLATTEGSSLRTAWSITQLAAGVLAAVGCHVFNFLFQAADDSEVGLLDLFLKPVRLWVRTCHRLPRRLWLVDTAACGIVAAIMSLVVIGGLPYDRLWDWGFKAPPKQNLMGAVMDRVKELDNGEGADNLEDAVGDFAGKQGLDDELPKPEPPKPRERADCVILGYQLDRDGRLASLVLGAAHRSALAFAGRVTPKLSDDESAELLESLTALKADRSLVPITNVSAVWVQPKFTCRVTFTEQQKDGRLRDVEWDSLLGTMELTK